MRLREFRVGAFRCIWDSSSVAVGDIAALVGKNESGKTALLEALVHLNKGREFDELDICDEMQMRGQVDESTIIVEGIFELTAQETELVSQNCAGSPAIKRLRIGRKYGAKQVFYDFMGVKFAKRMDVNEKARAGFISAIENVRGELQAYYDSKESGNDPVDVQTKATIEQHLTELANLQDTTPTELRARIEGLARALKDGVPILNFSPAMEKITNASDGLLGEVEVEAEVRSYVYKNLHPRFVYFSEYKKIHGLVHIPTYLAPPSASERQKLDTGQLLDRRETVANLFYLADLDPAYLEQIKTNPPLRTKYLRQCSAKLTQALARTWETQRIELEFDYGIGDVLSVNVADVQDDGTHTNAGPLSRRSEGFRWHFSFYVNFVAETQKEELKEAILFLDEPGLHLHPAQQVGMLEVLKDLAKTNQVLYTTHSPYLIYDYSVGAVLTVELDPFSHLSKITPRLWKGDTETIVPILHSLGTPMVAAIQEPSLVPHSPPTVVVEGESDMMYLVAMEHVIAARRKKALAPRLTFQHANGASNVGAIAMFFREKGFRTLALYDNEPDAREYAKALREQVFPNEDILNTSIDGKQESDMEDLLTEDDYLTAVNELYRVQLRDAKFSIVSKKDLETARQADPSLVRVVPTVEAIWQQHSAEGWGNFSKKKVCAKVCELAAQDEKYPTEKSLERFETLLARFYERLTQLPASAALVQASESGETKARP